MNCSNCNSHKLIPYARMIDKGDVSPLQFAVTDNPDAAIFKGWHLFDIAATVCCDCGRVMFTAMGDLKEAWEAFEKSGKEIASPGKVVAGSPEGENSELGGDPHK